MVLCCKRVCLRNSLADVTEHSTYNCESFVEKYKIQRVCVYVRVWVCTYVCVEGGCMGYKVLAQRIRYRDYTIWMALQGTESRVKTFRM